jgi:DNA-directed RNA polymerase specialized sigma24 family protein
VGSQPNTCALIAGQVSAYLDHAVPEKEAAEIKAHLDGCADCSAYLGQLRSTIDILGRRPGAEVPDALREAVAGHGAGDEQLTEVFASSLPQLLAVARAIDAEHAEDLVQNTWIDVLRSPLDGPVEPADLLARLDALAERHRAADIDTDRPRDDRITEIARTEPDKDADTAELYYPGLYSQKPDLGDWVDAPNSWPGAAQILSPEDESTTEELYGVVDAALADLPPKGAELLSLVDIEGVPIDAAIRSLRLEPESARRDLDRARDHVRRRVDAYLSGAEST